MSSDTHNRTRDCTAFEVAIICALSLEADAMMALFDHFWEQEQQHYEKSDGDTNSYTIGRLGQHHVVLVHMSHMGKASAANVAANLRSSFPHIRLALLVGICGGVPFVDGGKEEITLGDIVISTQIVQSDFGRQYSDTFIRKNTAQDNLSRQNQDIGAFISSLQTKVATLEEQIRTNTVTLFNAENPKNLKRSEDIFWCNSFRRPGHKVCPTSRPHRYTGTCYRL
ncbi:5'-methylthioadenosine/S-adenosylhomocysteine nucleosidase family protein [Aspergillus fischeri NRRL 181]|uniref:Nucleoside phosphorylase domain-containing protein n=1 Tax=Neosartorya fischeri (strain ATCC 1020 / DSM 3700 / CBS 544.65 / FGSC A1164 / JCM 1740 / NRRL 181 / WB 181) TaxID=331117 RepID=A1DKB3_NEOFI|nr:uncharacterized protein NFIA_005140 [Aspergillus fischeri NRRL 181]EAW17152.1 hypothetical protein NFIA_005140 [Aspergillus fischeri NRRL 181]